MKNFHLIFSHDLTNEQIEDAKKTFQIGQFIPLPKILKELWSNIPPQIEEITEHLSPLYDYMKREIKKGDIVLVQGDFGATYKAVNVAKSLGAVAVYATTKREIKEKIIDNSVIKESIFQHERFRVYG